MTYRRAFLAGIFTALAMGLAWGCAAAEGGSGMVAGNGGDNGALDSGKDEDVFTAGGATGDPDGDIVLNALCGKHPHCVPDFPPNSCVTFKPPPPPNGGASAGGNVNASSPAGASGEGGAGGMSGASNGADGGSSGAPAVAGASGAAPDPGAGAGGMSGGGEGGGAGAAPVDAAIYGCQVQRTTGSPRVPVSECSVVGSGGDNAPCLTSADCKVGFGCVGDQNAGLCQAYCCESADNCQQGKYCAERSLRDAFVNALPKGTTDPSSDLKIPVCVPAENCDLGAPYPCTKGAQCQCPAGTACLVVRSDGTTTCAAPPGVGKVGDACPCAWGHVCSAATNKCLQLCYAPGPPSCGNGRCQSASALPDGWGVCVGTTPSGG